MAHVLLVDDEATVAEVFGRYLQRAGHRVTHASDGMSALVRAREMQPDLVVLDWMLPGISGIEVCRQLRAAGAVAIIMLTARGDTDDRILGLGEGADDYVVKPVAPAEIVARVEAVLRRTRPAADDGAASHHLSIGDLSIDLAGRLAARGGQPLALTRKEFDLLAYLAAHPGRCFSRDQILDAAWGGDFDGDASTVTVHVRRLREKIEVDPDHPELIQTVWGVGYRFGAPQVGPR